MFNSRQGGQETVSAWAGRTDATQAGFRVSTRDEVKVATALMDQLARACFVQGLASDTIQPVVRARGEATLLSACIQTALEEESATSSAAHKGSIGYGSVRSRNLPPPRRGDRESNQGFPGSRSDRHTGRGSRNSGSGVGGNVNVAMRATECVRYSVTPVRD
jgi:hypothetical protein